MTDQERQEQEKAAQEKMTRLYELAPELQQGITQDDMERIIARLSMEKAMAERHINVLADKLIAMSAERDKLQAERDMMVGQMVMLKKAAQKKE